MEALLRWPPEVSVSNRREVIQWWESRRLNFNTYVGVIGVVSWLLVLTAGSAAIKPGVDFEEPFAMIVGPFYYCLFANVCYSFGWIVDAAFFRRAPRVRLYKFGMLFSVALTALPGIWAVVAWITTLITGQKLD